MTTRRKKTAQSKPSEAIPSLFEHRFERPELLTWALTHRSLAYESKPETQPSPDADNEQLEFVGDAVLGLAVAESLFRLFPGSREGELTRSARIAGQSAASGQRWSANRAWSFTAAWAWRGAEWRP